MKKYWTTQDLYEQALIAMVMFNNDNKIASNIINSLRERSKTSDDMGMYWDKNRNSYSWNQSAIKTQVALIHAFSTALFFDRKDEIWAEIENMCIWLLRQKQTQLWESDIATVDALGALLIDRKLPTESSTVNISIGGKEIDEKAEAGTGYFKKTYSGNEITAEMANISITKTDDNISWGAAYWQYLEDIDKIEKQGSGLSIDKKLFLVQQTEKGNVMKPIDGKTRLKVGDKITVRLVIRIDRDMEYLCLKDLRATCFEPVEQLSGYRYAAGIGFYRSIKDASVQFFFNRLNKGIYTLEYELWVTRPGEYSNGIADMQCLYAPEFAGHSASERVRADK